MAKQNLPQISAELGLKLKLVKTEPGFEPAAEEEGWIRRSEDMLANGIGEALAGSEQVRMEEQQASKLGMRSQGVRGEGVPPPLSTTNQHTDIIVNVCFSV